MTLDVTIGKLKGTRYIEQCPNSEIDVTDSTFSHYTKEAYRSGSTGFWDFWMHKNEKLVTIYMNMRKHPWTNDWDRAKLKPFAKDILALKDTDFSDVVDIDRLRWLQYWTAKAVELYGDKAGISFS